MLGHVPGGGPPCFFLQNEVVVTAFFNEECWSALDAEGVTSLKMTSKCLLYMLLLSSNVGCLPKVNAVYCATVQDSSGSATKQGKTQSQHCANEIAQDCKAKKGHTREK